MTCEPIFNLRFTIHEQSWGCTGFDAVIGKSGLRVRALFSVINEHLKRNDNKVVSLADRRAAKVAALAA